VQPFNVAPQGGSIISSPIVPVTSGIIANFPPFGNTVTFSFTASGAYPYMCRIHDHMVGTIVVSA
jgi:hypothetical protein